jgi:hypothetical protein
LRHVATTHPYDDPASEGTSLRGSVDVVAAELAQEVAQRVTIAGVEIVEGSVGMVEMASPGWMSTASSSSTRSAKRRW